MKTVTGSVGMKNKPRKALDTPAQNALSTDQKPRQDHQQGVKELSNSRGLSPEILPKHNNVKRSLDTTNIANEKAKMPRINPEIQRKSPTPDENLATLIETAVEWLAKQLPKTRYVPRQDSMLPFQNILRRIKSYPFPEKPLDLNVLTAMKRLILEENAPDILCGRTRPRAVVAQIEHLDGAQANVVKSAEKHPIFRRMKTSPGSTDSLKSEEAFIQKLYLACSLLHESMRDGLCKSPNWRKNFRNRSAKSCTLLERIRLCLSILVEPEIESLIITSLGEEEKKVVATLKEQGFVALRFLMRKMSTLLDSQLETMENSLGTIYAKKDGLGIIAQSNMAPSNTGDANRVTRNLDAVQGDNGSMHDVTVANNSNQNDSKIYDDITSSAMPTKSLGTLPDRTKEEIVDLTGDESDLSTEEKSQLNAIEASSWNQKNNNVLDSLETVEVGKFSCPIWESITREPIADFFPGPDGGGRDSPTPVDNGNGSMDMDMSDDDKPTESNDKESRRPLATVQRATGDTTDIDQASEKSKQLAALKAKRLALRKKIEDSKREVVTISRPESPVDESKKTELQGDATRQVSIVTNSFVILCVRTLKNGHRHRQHASIMNR